MPARGELRECAGGSETFIRRAKLTLSPSPSLASKEPAQTHASLSCYQTAAVLCTDTYSLCVCAIECKNVALCCETLSHKCYFIHRGR